MPKFNIEYKNRYYVFSTISDSIIEEFDTFQQLQDYRLKQYGVSNFENEQSFNDLNANKMEFKEIIISQIVGGNENNDKIIECFNLLENGDKEEAFRELIEMYKEEVIRNDK